MTSMAKSERKNRVRRMFPMYVWWASLLIIILCCFSTVFVGASFYQQAGYLHQDFIAKGIDKSKYLSRVFDESVLEHQKDVGLLSQDVALLNALILSDEQELVRWVRNLPRLSNKTSYFVYSAQSKKIYSSGNRIKGVNEVVLESLTPSLFSIHRSSRNGYFFSITKLLRFDGRVVGKLGCTVSFKDFWDSIGLDHSQFAVLIEENGILCDLGSGEGLARDVIQLRDALQGVQPTVFLNKASVAIPFGVSGLYLYAFTDRLDSEIGNRLGTWLLVMLPVCVIVFLVTMYFVRRGSFGVTEFANLIGDNQEDLQKLIAVRNKTIITEMHDAANNLIGFYEKLMRSEELKLYTGIFDATSMGLVLCDYSGRILEWNPMLIELLGSMRNNWHGVPVKELFRKVDQLAVIMGMAHVRQSTVHDIERHGAFKARLRLNSSRKGAQHVDTIIKKVEFAGKESLLFMLYNVTDQVTAERQMQQAKSSAEQVARDRHHFYMGLTAEIEPLAEALNQSIILLGETTPTRAQQRHLERITVHNDLLFELITNIRDFALLETGSMVFERTSFQLEALLKQAHASTYSRAMQMQSDICVYLDPTTPQELWFDFSKSLQVITSLINLAAKQVYGGVIVLTVTSGEEHDGTLRLRFDICAQPKASVSSSEEHGSTLPEPACYGQRGQQLCLAIVQRIIKIFPILQFHQRQSSSGAYFYTVIGQVTSSSSKRAGLESLLEGKNIGLVYCPHNTPGFVARMLSRLGAQCEFVPAGQGFCEEVIRRQDEFDIFICCDCIFSAVPKEEQDKYCSMLTRPIYTISHSYWEPTNQNPKIVMVRKPFLANEMLALFCDRLLPQVKDYAVNDDLVATDIALLVNPDKDEELRIRQVLEDNGYVPVVVDDVASGPDAIISHRPSIVLIDTGNITIDGYWLIKEIRDIEEKERLLPATMVMTVGQEHSAPPQQIDSYTLVIGKPLNANELIRHVLNLKGQTEKSA